MSIERLGIDNHTRVHPMVGIESCLEVAKYVDEAIAENLRQEF